MDLYPLALILTLIWGYGPEDLKKFSEESLLSEYNDLKTQDKKSVRLISYK